MLKTSELKMVKKIKGNKSKITLIQRESSIKKERVKARTHEAQIVNQAATPSSLPTKAPLSYKRCLLSPQQNEVRNQNNKEDTTDNPTPMDQSEEHYNLETRRQSDQAPSELYDMKTRRQSERFNKSKFSSQVSYTRHRQSVSTMKMFTVVVVVFGTLALPHQISWFLTDFSNLPVVAGYAFVMLTFVGKILNCWIYSWFNKDIRRAYIDILCRLLCCVRGRRETSVCESEVEVKQPQQPQSPPSLYTKRREQLFMERKVSFDVMFNDYVQRMRRSFYRSSLYVVKDIAEDEQE